MLVDSCLKVQRPGSVAHDDDAPAALVVTSTHLDETTDSVPIVVPAVVPVVVVIVAPVDGTPLGLASAVV